MWPSCPQELHQWVRSHDQSSRHLRPPSFRSAIPPNIKMMTCLFTPDFPCLEDFLNPGFLCTWLKSNTFFFPILWSFNYSKYFHIFNLIWLSQYPCEAGRADIVKLIWIMSKRDLARWVPYSVSLEKESLSGWLSGLTLFSSSPVSWLQPSGEEIWGWGWGEAAVRKDVQKGKMFVCLTHRWLLISQGEVRAPVDNDVCIMVLNGNGAGPAPIKS